MNDKERRIEVFTSVPVPKAVATLAIPSIISSLVMVLYNLADTFYVGMLNDPVQNAAVTLIAPVLLAFNAVNNLFGVGGSSMMSRALGRQDLETVKKSSSTSFYSAFAGGLLISLICIIWKTPLLNLLGADKETIGASGDYMLWTVCAGAVPAILNVVFAYLVRSEGASLHASLGTMSGCILNMILDPFFILPWGLNMGAAGAGLATMISNCFACLYFFVLMYKKRDNTFISINPKYFTARKAILWGIFIVGIPASIQNLLNVTGQTILNNMAAGFGAAAIGAMGICQKVNNVPWMMVWGATQGMMPLVSYTYSSGNIKRMKDAVWFTFKGSMIFLLIVASLYYGFAPQVIRAFSPNQEIIMHGAKILRGFCFGIIFVAIDFLGVGVYQATGLGHYALFLAILRKIILEIPALYLFNYLWPLYGLAYTQLFTEVILAVLAIIIMRHLFRSFEQKYANKEHTT